MSTLKENLTATRAMLADKWTRGHYAENAEGITVGLHNVDEICRVCTMGAMYLVKGHQTPFVVDQDIFDMIGALGFAGEGELMIWNDHKAKDQAEVLARFDDAIARCEM